MSIEIAAVRREAPATRANAYLNAGTNGPLSRYAAEAIAAANQSQLNDGRIGPGVYEKSNAISTELRAGDPSQSTTDRTFTGQKADGTGLLYYNARYYDSALGTFLSPDTLVPDAARVVDYNRFLYVRGNPLKYSDPSGHCATTTNGEPDMDGDGECWQMANAIAGLGYTEQGFWDDWGGQDRSEWWLNNIANQSFATLEYLTPFYERYQSEFEGRTGLRRPVSLEPVVNPELHQPGEELILTVGRDVYACTHSVTDCGKALDDASTALSATAMGCAVAGFACSGPAAVLSTFTGIAGTVLSGINALVGNGRASAIDTGVSATTTGLGAMRESAKAYRSVGFGISLIQWLWSHQEGK